MKNKRNGLKIDPDVLIWLCMIVGLCGLVIQFLLSEFTKLSPLYTGISILAAYSAAAVAIIIKSRLTIRQYTEMFREPEEITPEEVQDDMGFTVICY